jgi:hypothetical protein
VPSSRARALVEAPAYDYLAYPSEIYLNSLSVGELTDLFCAFFFNRL